MWFKLIAGGSLTDAEAVASVVRCYAEAGIQAVDLAPVPAVVDAVAGVLSELPVERRPLLMVSLPLDPDPHFRKIEVRRDTCTACGDCVPVCPSEALSKGPEGLIIDQPLCYGCGRCLPVCEPHALTLHPWAVDADILLHPAVQGVELHTTAADPVLLERFWADYGDRMAGKTLSLCFRPQRVPTARWLALLALAQQLMAPAPLIVQVDGQPMSGRSDEPEASLPALHAARDAWTIVQAQADSRIDPQRLFWTLSGGINAWTPDWLMSPVDDFIQGVGVGTVARQAVWSALEQPLEAVERARNLVKVFEQCVPCPVQSVVPFEFLI